MNLLRSKLTVALAIVLFAPAVCGQLVGSLEGIAPPPGKERPALATSINGPSEIVFANGYLYVMETAGSRVFRVDVKASTITLILPDPKDTFYKRTDRYGGSICACGNA